MNIIYCVHLIYIWPSKSMSKVYDIIKIDTGKFARITKKKLKLNF